MANCHLMNYAGRRFLRMSQSRRVKVLHLMSYAGPAAGAKGYRGGPRMLIMIITITITLIIIITTIVTVIEIVVIIIIILIVIMYACG